MIASKYHIEKEINRGAFGIIYKGIYNKTREQVAIKIDNSQFSTINHEAKIIQYLYMAKVRNIPSVYWFGIHSGSPCLVMTLYECSLYDYYLSDKNMTPDKMNILLISAIDIFENIHKLFVLHRDIKPQNFMIKNGEIYLIDFGLSMFYINENGEHYPDQHSDTMIGSPKFASINIHNGHRYSRRDDMISLGYLYLFMIGISFEVTNPSSSVDKNSIYHLSNQEFKIQKEQLRTSELPLSIKYYINYVYDLKYEEKPNYEPLKLLFMK